MVTVEVALVAAVMHAVVRRRVERRLHRPSRSHGVGVNPVLIDQVQRPRGFDQVRANAETGECTVRNEHAEGTRYWLAQRCREVVVLAAVMWDVNCPQRTYFVHQSMVPVVDQVPAHHGHRPSGYTVTKVAPLSLRPLPLGSGEERCRGTDNEASTRYRGNTPDLRDLASACLHTSTGSGGNIGACRDDIGDRRRDCTDDCNSDNGATDAALRPAPRHCGTHECHREWRGQTEYTHAQADDRVWFRVVGGWRLHRVGVKHAAFQRSVFPRHRAEIEWRHGHRQIHPARIGLSR